MGQYLEKIRINIMFRDRAPVDRLSTPSAKMPSLIELKPDETSISALRSSVGTLTAQVDLYRTHPTGLPSLLRNFVNEAEKRVVGPQLPEEPGKEVREVRKMARELVFDIELDPKGDHNKTLTTLLEKLRETSRHLDSVSTTVDSPNSTSSPVILE